jgi:molecular chaperone DnaJ
LPISIITASLGGNIEVPTIAGWVKMKIPEGIESGIQIRLDGKGMPHLQRKGFGDMIVKVQVKTPKRLSKKAKELLENLKKEIE